jgi:hypothetical protein
VDAPGQPPAQLTYSGEASQLVDVTRPMGLSDSGSVLLWDPHERHFQWTDPHTGRTTEPVGVRVGGPVDYPGHWPRLAPDSGTVIVPVFTTASDVDPYMIARPIVALLEFDLHDGHLVARGDLAAEDDWELLASLPGGVVLLRERRGPTELALLEDVTGTPRVVSSLPAGSQVTVRGTHGH